jgi:UDP-3-O-[3-hydroxymyristoyl] glucosamine N-acyltransferase
LRLEELATALGCRLDGPGDLEVGRVAALESAGPGDISFFANHAYAAALQATQATAVIAADGVDVPSAALRTPHPYVAFARALALLHPTPRPPAGVHPTAVVDGSAALGPEVVIGAYVCVGPGVVIGARTLIHPHVVIGEGTTVGEDCVLHAHVSVRERVTLGNRVVVQNGAIIGSDGFGFAPLPDGGFLKVPQLGGVVVGDDVEIGALTAIDRPPVGATVIGAGTKIDNLVQVGHGVEIGRDVLLVSQVGIAGSTTIGDRVVLAGQVGVAGHLTIGAGARASAQTGIPNSVAPGAFVSGYPAIDNRDWLRASAVFRRLPELRRAVSDLARRLAALESPGSAAGDTPDQP